MGRSIGVHVIQSCQLKKSKAIHMQTQHYSLQKNNLGNILHMQKYKSSIVICTKILKY